MDNGRTMERGVVHIICAKGVPLCRHAPRFSTVEFLDLIRRVWMNSYFKLIRTDKKDTKIGNKKKHYIENPCIRLVLRSLNDVASIPQVYFLHVFMNQEPG
jgi:hypothetical protein